jgi:hypothetical protein
MLLLCWMYQTVFLTVVITFLLISSNKGQNKLKYFSKETQIFKYHNFFSYKILINDLINNHLLTNIILFFVVSCLCRIYSTKMSVDPSMRSPVSISSTPKKRIGQTLGLIFGASSLFVTSNSGEINFLF